MTDARFATLVIQLVKWVIPARTNVLVGIVQWEAALLAIERDHQEKLSWKMKRALLLNILPDAMQKRIYEHLDRLTTYESVED